MLLSCGRHIFVLHLLVFLYIYNNICTIITCGHLNKRIIYIFGIGNYIVERYMLSYKVQSGSHPSMIWWAKVVTLHRIA